MSELLISNDEYLKYGLHIGTKYKTKDMAPYIYMTKPNGLSVMNIQKIDERVKSAANFLAQFEPNDILFASRRENGWKAVAMASKILGSRFISGRYPPGILTNAALDNYTEAKAIFTIDPWPDVNIIKDAHRVGVPVVSMCDTNNLTKNIDLVVPGNNKGKKSIALTLFLITREIQKIKGIISDYEEFKYTPEDFLSE